MPAESPHRAGLAILDVASRGQVRALSRGSSGPSDVRPLEPWPVALASSMISIPLPVPLTPRALGGTEEGIPGTEHRVTVPAGADMECRAWLF